ncbi:Ribosomal protein L7/L12 C-terminal domain-containing protein [Filimonas lacunae]|uniref:Ribosomal protein L7/L12 C-terminal domain-containing protein n=1 Tax=Filimonas lacunae TaxID=477680 RepID=A0A173MKJ3_9BACT|nr:ribosomal protein L7/L12 [Filimonas lacunae]BAV07989.1 hypothetical protein FLA_4022 [Filimonas lacunae]SIT07549.1 Ribosomal protein L7/L12 C-terminal domain-containing protein [Filimonas lacunae]
MERLIGAKFSTYFGECHSYWWTWQDDASVISLREGNTIVFQEELCNILEDMQVQGWPPLGALLLILMACGNNTSASLHQLHDHLLLDFLKNEPKGDAEGADVNGLFVKGWALIRNIAEIPKEYTQGPNKRLLVLHLLRKNRHPVAMPRTAQWLQLFRSDYKDSREREGLVRVLTFGQGEAIRKFLGDFAFLAKLAAQYPTVDSILEGLVPGQEILPVPEWEEELATNSMLPEAWIETLLAKDATFAVGALIRHVWAGLRIPLHMYQPGAQPLGGITDITNKGSLEGLLVSEFANEEVLLLSRLANNEALYYQREVPPVADDTERVILLDVSLKNWGVPRQLAYALGIAIGRHPKTDMNCHLYAIGKQCREVLYQTTEEIENSLRQMDTGVHAASGLQQFFAGRQPTDRMEIIFISTEAAARHEEVQQVIRLHYSVFKYWITVNGSGRVSVWKNKRQGQQLVQQMQLPLEKLWSKKLVSRVPKQEKVLVPKTDMPIGDTLDRCPLLYPARKYVLHLLASDEKAYIVSKHRQLFQVYKSDIGYPMKLLPLKLPSHVITYVAGKGKDGVEYLFCFKKQVSEVEVINLQTGGSQKMYYRSNIPDGFLCYEGAFYHVTANSIAVFTLEDGLQFAMHQGYSEVYQAIYEKRKQEINDLWQQWWMRCSNVLIHISRLYVSSSGKLVFNSHRLVLKENGSIQLERTRKDDGVWIAAQYNQRQHCFEFADGSQVSVDKEGMIKIKRALPAGQSKYELVLSSRGEQRLYTIKTVKEGMSWYMGLNNLVELVENCPVVVCHTNRKQQAELFLQKLLDVGASGYINKVTTEPIVYFSPELETSLMLATPYCYTGSKRYKPFEGPGSWLEKMNGKEFYDTFIQPLITQIQDYAASS